MIFPLNKKQGIDKQLDTDLLMAMVPIMEELIKPMRFLSDLRAIWEDLSDQERADIEASRVFRDRDHEKLVEHCVARLTEMLAQLKSSKYKDLKLEMQHFLRDWRTEEPDRVKVLQGMIRNNCG